MGVIDSLLGAGQQNLRLMLTGHRVELRAQAHQQVGKAREGEGIDPFLAGAAMEIAPMRIYPATGGSSQVGQKQTPIRRQVQSRGFDRPRDDTTKNDTELRRRQGRCNRGRQYNQYNRSS